MQSADLQALLDELREQQDGFLKPVVEVVREADSEGNDRDVVSDSTQKEQTNDPEKPTTLPPPPPLPSQERLEALLSSLTGSANQVEETPIHAELPDLTFSDSLSYLQKLGTDKVFLEALEDLIQAQANVELTLKDERNRLIDTLRRNSGLSLMEQTQKLKKWDMEALDRWRRLQESQQLQLQHLSVPTFSITRDPSALKRQQKVINVLKGFMEDQ